MGMLSSLPPCGGSGLKCLHSALGLHRVRRLPPCGGSGLKLYSPLVCFCRYTSPSMRREWIEINLVNDADIQSTSLPPCGGSGLKSWRTCQKIHLSKSPSMRREWIEISGRWWWQFSDLSPSMRREWIEIPFPIISSLLIMSPSMRREWIEIISACIMAYVSDSLPPCGGSGLKCALGLL